MLLCDLSEHVLLCRSCLSLNLFVKKLHWECDCHDFALDRFGLIYATKDFYIVAALTLFTVGNFSSFSYSLLFEHKALLHMVLHCILTLYCVKRHVFFKAFENPLRCRNSLNNSFSFYAILKKD